MKNLSVLLLSVLAAWFTFMFMNSTTVYAVVLVQGTLDFPVGHAFIGFLEATAWLFGLIIAGLAGLQSYDVLLEARKAAIEHEKAVALLDDIASLTPEQLAVRELEYKTRNAEASLKLHKLRGY